MPPERGIGLLPLGWAKFVDRPAGDYADRCVDGRDDPAPGTFAPLAEALMESGSDFESGLALIEAHMQTLLDPTMSWLRAMDCHYHDQAHFVRDFHRFMGMSPSAHGRFDHPIPGAAARDRAAIAGKAIQVLHKPSQAPLN